MYHAGSIEDQFVLAPHGVQVGHVQLVVGRPGGQHSLPLGSLAGVERRGVDVNDQLGPGLPLHGQRPDGIPDVLADTHSDGHFIDYVHRARVARPEVAFLVEHPVVGQVNLSIGVDQLSVVAQGGRVVDVRSHVDVPHQHGDSLGGRNHPLHGGNVIPQEGGLEQQVFGRIAGDGQLREGHQVGLDLPGLLQVIDDLGSVARDIPYRGVDLGQRQPKSSRHDSIENPWARVYPVKLGDASMPVTIQQRAGRRLPCCSPPRK